MGTRKVSGGINERLIERIDSMVLDFLTVGQYLSCTVRRLENGKKYSLIFEFIAFQNGHVLIHAPISTELTKSVYSHILLAYAVNGLTSHALQTVQWHQHRFWVSDIYVCAYYGQINTDLGSQMPLQYLTVNDTTGPHLGHR